MKTTSPIRRLVPTERSDVCSWKYGRCFILCVVLTIFVFMIQFLIFSSVFDSRTIPSILQDIGLYASNISSVKSINSSLAKHISTAPSTINRELEYFKRTHFMTVSGNGRLGNQMFEVAALIGTAIRHNYTPFISKTHRLNNVFDIKHAKNIHMTNTAVAGEGKPGAYNTKIEMLSHNKNWTLNGYFQSWKYFHHCKKEIISSFKFKPNTIRKATEVLKTLKAKGRPLVGVHVRRSDMASARELRRGYNVATPEYMKKALSYFRNNTKNPLFVIVSDDRQWTSIHAKGPDVVYAGTGRPESDMAILSLCSHTIITSGSFGWWGAYLNNGKTVYFSNFPSHGSWLAKQYEPADYYPPEWIGME